ncbi:hemerythrin domain-containing protein [Foetidibacter luteolus]|uniref:hemerythrin domain-containing protein n=1 Tax=Foetidibacter luteolus TaxID=2608880 RepID=UPI00129B7A04|nr:hemerythrin domain-containing protein [Foetidibacter luteolus]
MQQARYNIFNQIHKGLRAMLYDTALLIQQTDFDNREDASATIKQLETLLHYFDGHAEHEDKFILPWIEKFDKKLVDDFEAEHVTDHALSKNLFEYIADWKAADDEQKLVDLGRLIFYEFNLFVAFNLNHMNKEEQLLNQVLWEHYTDAEILGMEHAIISSIPQDVLLDESRWMMRSINNAEATAWLAGIRNNAPAPVFDVYMAMAEEEMTLPRFTQVKAGLSEGVMVI